MSCHFINSARVAGRTFTAVSVCSWWQCNDRRKICFLQSKGGGNIYLIRHGESTVNRASRHYRQEGDSWPGRAYHEVEFFDAPLTARGKEEAMEVQQDLKERMRSSEAETAHRLVITSTLHRALETAAFGVLPLIPPDQQTTWIALECVRESATGEIHSLDGVDVPHEVSMEKPCNSRRPLSHACESFPHMNFSLCKEKDPIPPIETIAMVDERVAEFVDWLRRWVEQQRVVHADVQIDVVLVSHYVFLHRFMSKFAKASNDSSTSCCFKNCEVRALPLSSILHLDCC